MLYLFVLTLLFMFLALLLSSISYWITGKLNLTKGCGRRPLLTKGKHTEGKDICDVCGKITDSNTATPCPSNNNK